MKEMLLFYIYFKMMAHDEMNVFLLSHEAVTSMMIMTHET